jgi:hypothetical protein
LAGVGVDNTSSSGISWVAILSHETEKTRSGSLRCRWPTLAFTPWWSKWEQTMAKGGNHTAPCKSRTRDNGGRVWGEAEDIVGACNLHCTMQVKN